jgi:hypothetical protein
MRVNVITQSPPDVTVIVTPVALSTSAEQDPEVTVAARAGEAINVDGIAITANAKRQTEPISDNIFRVNGDPLYMTKSYS